MSKYGRGDVCKNCYSGSFSQIHVAGERAQLELRTAAIDRARNCVVHFEPEAPAAPARVLNRGGGGGLELKVEVSEDVTHVAPKLQGRLRRGGPGYVECAHQRRE